MEVYVSDTDVIDEVNEVYATQVSAYAISTIIIILYEPVSVIDGYEVVD